MGSEIIGATDSVAYELIKANRYGPGSLLFDLLMIALIIGIGYKVLKRWKPRRLEKDLSQLPQSQ